MDAFCGIGTVGHGGRVKGNRIKCPFHGWCFDGSGMREVPYSPEARLENRGLGSLPPVGVTACSSPGGTQESTEYSLPVIDECQDSQWSRYYRHAWTVPTVWYEIQENIVDNPFPLSAASTAWRR